MVEMLLGGVFGGLLRLAPEVLKIFTQGSSQRHELAMRKLDIEAAKQVAADQLHLVQTQVQGAVDVAGVEALKEAIRTQLAPTGVWWVDVISVITRPVITWCWMGLFAAVKVAQLVLLMGQGSTATAVLQLWGPFEQNTFGGIISFWFLDRVLRATSAASRR